MMMRVEKSSCEDRNKCCIFGSANARLIHRKRARGEKKCATGRAEAERSEEHYWFKMANIYSNRSLKNTIFETTDRHIALNSALWGLVYSWFSSPFECICIRFGGTSWQTKFNCLHTKSMFNSMLSAA